MCDGPRISRFDAAARSAAVLGSGIGASTLSSFRKRLFRRGGRPSVVYSRLAPTRKSAAMNEKLLAKSSSRSPFAPCFFPTSGTVSHG